MSLLVTAEQLERRCRIARGSLGPLAAGLRRELEPLIASPPDVPREKALLSRAGGRCPVDGSLLAYDPFDPRHRCPVCGREVAGVEHDRFRLYWHQLWLAERTLHAALLASVTADAACRSLAITLLDRFADRYLDYPNRDNVLGPSRPFFSTYLESIWLLQLMVALDLLELGSSSDDVAPLGGRVRDRVIAPSATLIESFDEGRSNRQVWNDAALAAAAVMLDRSALLDRALHGASGVEQLLTGGLLTDGSWYEGENYHLFAHRGLWYGVTIAEGQGRSLPSILTGRFQEGFASPFRTLLPDLTYPSRRDSQYAVSVRQPRFAESCELGLARNDDDRLVDMLARLYDPSVPRTETGRWSTSADVERNLPPTGLTRADLSWRSLLFARAVLPPLETKPLTSDILTAQGIGILRGDAGALYAALDYGVSGGGHGHPDRLNVLFSDGATRWFDDPGTGSYVDPSLHWYRSTLAHTAPLVDGRSQPAVDGRLLEFTNRTVTPGVSAEAELAPGLVVRRGITLVGDVLLDALEWESRQGHEVALPLHGVDLVREDGTPLPRRAEAIAGGAGLEDGFLFLQNTARIDVPAPARKLFLARGVSVGKGGRRLHGWVSVSAGAAGRAEWWSADAPDVPSRRALVRMLLVRVRARRGRIVGVWSARNAVAGVQVERSSATIEWRDGRRTRHELKLPSPPFVASRGQGSIVSTPTPIPLPATFALGERHYRRSEEEWREAGRPTAEVRLRIDAARRLVIDVDVHGSTRRFVPIDAENPLDNEPAAINGDGVQLYATIAGQHVGWLFVPVPETSEVARRQIDGWRTDLVPASTWAPTQDGYRLSVGLALPSGLDRVDLDVLVNETVVGRERRRGQLVLSGAEGEFVYLRGDRHEPGRLLHFTLSDV